MRDEGPAEVARKIGQGGAVRAQGADIALAQIFGAAHGQGCLPFDVFETGAPGKGQILFGRIENLTNKVYQETLGYGTAGLSLFGGIRLTTP